MVGFRWHHLQVESWWKFWLPLSFCRWFLISAHCIQERWFIYPRVHTIQHPDLSCVALTSRVWLGGSRSLSTQGGCWIAMMKVGGKQFMNVCIDSLCYSIEDLTAEFRVTCLPQQLALLTCTPTLGRSTNFVQLILCLLQVHDHVWMMLGSSSGISDMLPVRRRLSFKNP